MIIYDQRCAAEARRLRKRGLLDEPPRRVVINEAVCEGCGDCGTKSNCLSVLPLAHRVRREAPDRRPVVQPRLHLPRRRLPVVRHAAPRSGAAGADAAADAGAPPSSPTAPCCRPARCPAPTPPVGGRSTASTSPGSAGTGVVTANRDPGRRRPRRPASWSAAWTRPGCRRRRARSCPTCTWPPTATPSASATISPGGADLYLSGDLLQAASPTHLAKVRPGPPSPSSTASVTPTAAMLQTDLAPARPRGAAASHRRRGRGRPGRASSTRRASPRTCSPTPCWPTSSCSAPPSSAAACRCRLADVDEAMARQGRTAADNREAFEWGRWAVHDPAAVDARLVGAARERRAGHGTIRSVGRGAGHGAGAGRSGAACPADAARPARPPGRAGHRLPEHGAGRALPRPGRAAAARSTTPTTAGR